MEQQNTRNKPLESSHELKQSENIEVPSTSGITENKEIDLRKRKADKLLERSLDSDLESSGIENQKIKIKIRKRMSAADSGEMLWNCKDLQAQIVTQDTPERSENSKDECVTTSRKMQEVIPVV